MKHTPIHKWADTRPDLFECLAANDDLAEATVDEFDRAVGGTIGLAIMLIVAAAIGAMLAIGGVL